MNYRGSRLGLLLLASQLYHMGLDNIPPVTLAVLGLNVYLFLFPLASLSQTCLSVQHAVWLYDWRRLLLYSLHHVDDLHLYFNMASFVWKGRMLEREMGREWFIYLLSVFSLLIGLVYLLLEGILTWLSQDEYYSMVCGVGFSGVLFALKVVVNYYYPGGVTDLLGFPVSNRYASWVELVLIQIIVPEASFVGHLSGILVGLLYTRGTLKNAMQRFADFATSRRTRTRAYYRYSDSVGVSGYAATPSTRATSATPSTAATAGPAGGLSRSHQPAPDNLVSYTGGLSEEEQLQAAIINSVDDQGEGAPPPYGIDPAEEARAEEARAEEARAEEARAEEARAEEARAEEARAEEARAEEARADEARAEVVRQMRLRRFERPQPPPRRRVFF